MSQPHNEHHFIPAFMLRQWERGENSKLTTMTWRNGAVRLGRNRAKAVAKWTQLYTLHDAPEHAKNIIESKVFQKVDDEGAIAHAAILSGDLSSLSDELAQCWTRFVVALLMRSPWFIQEQVKKAPNVMLDTILKTALPEEDTAATLQAILSANPNFATTIALRSLVSSLPNSQSHAAIQGAQWILADVRASPIDLVIGDLPVLRTAGGFEGDFMLALPIAPKMLFMVHPENSTWAPRLRTLSARELVRRANIDSASQAIDYVFATSSEHIQLAKRYLRRR